MIHLLRSGQKSAVMVWTASVARALGDGGRTASLAVWPRRCWPSHSRVWDIWLLPVFSGILRGVPRDHHVQVVLIDLSTNLDPLRSGRRPDT